MPESGRIGNSTLSGQRARVCHPLPLCAPCRPKPKVWRIKLCDVLTQRKGGPPGGHAEMHARSDAPRHGTPPQPLQPRASSLCALSNLRAPKIFSSSPTFLKMKASFVLFALLGLVAAGRFGPPPLHAPLSLSLLAMGRADPPRGWLPHRTAICRARGCCSHTLWLRGCCLGDHPPTSHILASLFRRPRCHHCGACCLHP